MSSCSPVAKRNNRDKSLTSTTFGTNVLMGIQNKFGRGATLSELPGEMAHGSISADLSQNGNEADESLCTFTRISPANVTSNFGTNLLLDL